MERFDPTHRTYSVYICSGTGKNYRESGSYPAYGTSYLDAAKRLARHWNRCSFSKRYSDQWKKIGRRKGLPRFHHYVTDSCGNKLLMIPQK